LRSGKTVKIFVAIPAYDRKICVETARALLNEQTVAALSGHEISTRFLPGCSLITMARNQLVDDFIASDCDRLVFIDADLSWEPGSVLKLCAHDADCVGGAYRFKQEEEAYPVAWPASAEITPERLKYAEAGLMEVEGLPGGFIAIRRAALDRFREVQGNRTYAHFGHGAYAYFTAPFRDGRLMGEDNAFCADLRAAGVPILLDPSLVITHHDGPTAYTGCVADWLRARRDSIKAAAE
jgi:hypothetical protein